VRVKKAPDPGFRFVEEPRVFATVDDGVDPGLGLPSPDFMGEREKVFFAADHFPEQAGSFSKALSEGLPAAVPVVVEAAAGGAGFSLVGLAEMDYGTMGHNGFFTGPSFRSMAALYRQGGEKARPREKGGGPWPWR